MGGIIQIFSTSSWNCKINPSTFLNLRHLYKNRSCYFKFTSLKTKKDFSSFIFLNERKHFQELSTLYFSEFSNRRLPKIILDICHSVERITAQNVADLWVERYSRLTICYKKKGTMINWPCKMTRSRQGKNIAD